MECPHTAYAEKVNEFTSRFRTDEGDFAHIQCGSDSRNVLVADLEFEEDSTDDKRHPEARPEGADDESETLVNN